MTVTSEEVAAAKAFLSELPLGIASSTGIAAVRTLLASHEHLESTLRSAGVAAGSDQANAPAHVIEALVARVANLRDAIEARSAEAIVLKDRNTLTETRLQQALEEVRRKEETAGLLDEERQRAGRAEAGLRRAEDRMREQAGEISGLNRRIAELEQLVGAADLASQRHAERADSAEAAERAAREALAEKESAVTAIRARLTEAADAAARNAETLERKIASAASALSAKEGELAELEGKLRGERERIDDLVRTGEAQSSYAAAQTELAQSLKRELDERQQEIAALSQRLDATALDLRNARRRLDELQEALLPFAEMAESYDLADAHWVVDSGWCEDRRHRIVVADFRAARAVALGESSGSRTPLAPDLDDEKESPPLDAMIPEGTGPAQRSPAGSVASG